MSNLKELGTNSLKQQLAFRYVIGANTINNARAIDLTGLAFPVKKVCIYVGANLYFNNIQAPINVVSNFAISNGLSNFGIIGQLSAAKVLDAAYMSQTTALPLNGISYTFGEEEVEVKDEISGLPYKKYVPISAYVSGTYDLKFFNLDGTNIANDANGIVYVYVDYYT